MRVTGKVAVIQTLPDTGVFMAGKQNQRGDDALTYVPRWQKMVFSLQGDLHVASARVSPQLMSHDEGCSVPKLCPTLATPMDYSRSGFPALHYLPEFAQTHVHWIDDAIQPSYPLFLSSPPAFNLSKHQCLFQWVGSSHQETREDLRFSSFPGPGNTALW